MELPEPLQASWIDFQSKDAVFLLKKEAILVNARITALRAASVEAQPNLSMERAPGHTVADGKLYRKGFLNLRGWGHAFECLLCRAENVQGIL